MIRLRKFSLIYFSRLLAVSIFLTVTCDLHAQRAPAKQIGAPLTTSRDTIPGRPVTISPGTIPSNVRVIANDTIPETSDSTGLSGEDSIQTQRTDTFTLKLSKDTLAAPIDYYAEDSVVIHMRAKRITLYGKTKTTYSTTVLEAPKVELDQQTQILTAYSSVDSTGAIDQYAKFQEGDQSFQQGRASFHGL